MNTVLMLIVALILALIAMGAAQARDWSVCILFTMAAVYIAVEAFAF